VKSPRCRATVSEQSDWSLEANPPGRPAAY